MIGFDLADVTKVINRQNKPIAITLVEMKVNGLF
jgi:hypothetical protein